ncbi:hypothetical protein ACOME3_000249 [Neoechinorhynchus agilis]
MVYQSSLGAEGSASYGMQPAPTPWPSPFTDLASKCPGAVATVAERRKAAKYAELKESFHFVPRGIETFMAFGESALELVSAIARRSEAMKSDQRATAFLKHLPSRTMRECCHREENRGFTEHYLPKTCKF